MNKSVIKSFVIGIALAATSAPLYAQAPSESVATVAAVETNSGVIMISDPGEFTTALPDQRVGTKARLMVSEGSAATVVYDDGCKRTYDKPGVYGIAATCVRPAAAVAEAGGPSTALIAGGIILVGAGVYAIVDNNSSNDERPPVSR